VDDVWEAHKGDELAINEDDVEENEHEKKRKIEEREKEKPKRMK
jgi:hypothetical protein